MLIWMDLEMTGLDESRHVIVEIATLVTDDDLNIVAEGPNLVIHQPDEVMAEMDDFVTNMHTVSGLLEKIKTSTISEADAMQQTLDFIKEHSPEPNKIPLCGNSIRTDRTFLAKLDRFVMINDDGEVWSLPDYEVAMKALAEPTKVATIRLAKKLS